MGEPFRSAATSGPEAFEVTDEGDSLWMYRVDAPDHAICLDWATALRLAGWLVPWLDVPSA